MNRASYPLLIAIAGLLCPGTVHGQQQEESGSADRFGTPLPKGALVRMEAARLREHFRGETFALAMSPDGKLLASDNHAGLIRLWNPATAEELAQPNPPMQGERPLVFSPDGKILAAQGRGKRQEVLLYEPRSGKLVRSLSADDARIWTYAFAPNGKQLAVVHEQNVCFWDVETGKRTRTVKIGNEAPALAFSPDGKLLAIAGREEPISLWDVEAGKVRGKLAHEASALLFSSDGKVLFACGEDSISMWDVASQKKLAALEQEYAQCLALTGDPKTGKTRLATAGQGGRVTLWDVEQRKVLSRTRQHYAPGWAIAFTPDGKRLAWADQSPSVRFADVIGDEIKLVPEKKLQAFALAFSADGKTLTTAGDDTLRFWETESGKELRRLQTRGYDVRCFTSTRDEKSLILGCTDGKVRIRALAGGEDFRILGGTDGAIAAITLHGVRLAWAAGKQIHLWDLEHGKEERRLGGHEGTITALAFTSDGSVLASASEDETVRLWDPQSGKELRRFSRHGSPVNCVVFSPDGRRAASGSWDGQVRLWDPATGKELRVLKGHRDNVTSLHFSHDGTHLASGSWDHTVRLWTRAGAELACLEGHKDEVTAIGFSRDGKRLASASRDHTVLVWDVTRHRD